MFSLDNTYNIVFFTIACAVTAFFLAGCIFSLTAHRRKLSAWGIVYNVVTIIIWALLLVAAVALLLTKLKVFTLDGDALVLWGFAVPALGRVMRLLDYQLSMILLGASIILAAMSLVFNINRRVKDNTRALEPVPEMREINFDTDELPDGPIAAESEQRGQIGHVAKLGAPDEFREERIEVEEDGGETAASSDTPEAEQAPEEAVAGEQEAEKSAVFTAELKAEKEAEPEAAPQESIEPAAEEENPATEAGKAEFEAPHDGSDAQDVAADILQKTLKPNVYRDIVGQINDVIDDAILKTEPREVKPEVVDFVREREPEVLHEVEGEEIPVVGRNTFPPATVRTIVRRPSAANEIRAAAAPAATNKPTAAPKKQTAAAGKSKKPAAAPARKPVSVETKAETVEKKEAVAAASDALITRRHIIMNRRNVVNMFSDYLKNRDGQDKEKLEGSINTIIIK